MVILKKFVTKHDFFFSNSFLKGFFLRDEISPGSIFGLWHFVALFLKNLRRGRLWHHCAILVCKNSVSCLFTTFSFSMLKTCWFLLMFFDGFVVVVLFGFYREIEILDSDDWDGSGGYQIGFSVNWNSKSLSDNPWSVLM